MTAPRVVLDTNAALDWLLFDDPAIRPLAAAICAGRVSWLTDAILRAEYERVSHRLALTRGGADPAGLLARYDSASIHGPGAWSPPLARPRCTDPDDQVFVDFALSVSACLLVTRDRALLRLDRLTRGTGLRIAEPVRWTLALPLA